MILDKINQIVQIAMYGVICFGAIWILITVMGMQPDLLDIIVKIARFHFWLDFFKEVT